MPIPHIQIRQTYGRIGFDADLGTLDMRQPRPTVEMKTHRPVVDQNSERAHMEIDQERAWDALALGNNLETMQKIYSQGRDIAMQGIAKIVEKGNRMANIAGGGNAIAEIAKDAKLTFQEFDFAGPASFDNVDVRITAGQLNMTVQDGYFDWNVTVNKPEVSYHRGKLDMYMVTKPGVEITPPQIDLKL